MIGIDWTGILIGRMMTMVTEKMAEQDLRGERSRPWWQGNAALKKAGAQAWGFFSREDSVILASKGTEKQGGTESLAENCVPSDIRVFSDSLERSTREEDDIVVGPSVWDHQEEGSTHLSWYSITHQLSWYSITPAEGMNWECTWRASGLIPGLLTLLTRPPPINDSVSGTCVCNPHRCYQMPPLSLLSIWGNWGPEVWITCLCAL